MWGVGWGGISGVSGTCLHDAVSNMWEIRILMWDYISQRLSFVQEKHTHPPPSITQRYDIDPLLLYWLFPFRSCWAIIHLSRLLSGPPSLLFCLCFVIMYFQLRLISILRESEFSPNPEGKSLTGNQCSTTLLCSVGKQQLHDEWRTLVCCCCH